MPDLPENWLKKVQKILQRHVPGYEVRAFGSRVTGKARPHSDLDLVVMTDQPLERKLYYRLQDAFEESDLPIRVDLLDWQRISPEFRRHIEAHCEVVQAAGDSHNNQGNSSVP